MLAVDFRNAISPSGRTVSSVVARLLEHAVGLLVDVDLGQQVLVPDAAARILVLDVDELLDRALAVALDMRGAAAGGGDQLAADHQHPVILALDVALDDHAGRIIADAGERRLVARLQILHWRRCRWSRRGRGCRKAAWSRRASRSSPRRPRLPRTNSRPGPSAPARRHRRGSAWSIPCRRRCEWPMMPERVGDRRLEAALLHAVAELGVARSLGQVVGGDAAVACRLDDRARSKGRAR